MFNLGLARQTTLFISFIMVSLLLATGAILVGLGYRDDRADAINAQHEAACRAANVVENYLSERTLVLRLAGSLARQDDLSALAVLIQQQPEFLEVAIFDEGGELVEHVTSDEEFQLKPPDQDARLDYNISATDYLRLDTHLEDRYIAARIGLSSLRARVAHIAVGQGGIAYIIDANKRVIAHPEAAFIGEMIPADFRTDGSTYDDFEQQAVVGAACPVAQTTWLGVAELPTNEAFLESTAERGQIWLVLLLISTSITLWFAWWFSRRVLQPLQHLMFGVEHLSLGNLSFRLDMDRQDEFGDLGRAFDEMTKLVEQRTHELLDLNAELEARVAARTRELESNNIRMEAIAQALYRTNERANAANRAKSHFLANMSHELRTPLNSMILYHDLILRGAYGELTDKQLDRLGKSKESAQLLMHLINDVLDISKIEAGEMIINNQPTPIKTILEKSRFLIEPLIKSDNVTFEVDLEADLPDALGDSQRIQQITVNLLSNAAKFTKFGEITLKAWSLEVAGGKLVSGERPLGIDNISDGRWVAVSVSDSGIGIPEDMQQQIFEAFKQVDDSSTREFGGTGLGLAISKRLIEGQQGKIAVHSVVDEGSTFTYILPVVPTLQLE